MDGQSCRHDLKLSPLRVRGSGFYRRLSMIVGQRACRVSVCVKCGNVTAQGGIFGDLAHRPAERGSARDVLKWMDSNICEGRWRRPATDSEIRFYGSRVCREHGLMPPVRGGATKIWIPAATSAWSTSAAWSPTGAPAAGDAVQFGTGAGATQSSCNLTSATNAVASVDFTGYTGTFSMTNAAAVMNVTTTFKLVAGMTFTSNTSTLFQLTGTCAFTTAGKVISPAVWINAGGTLSLQDTWVTSTGSIVINGGGITTNNNNMTLWNITPNGTAAGTMNLGSSTITLQASSGSAWVSSSAMTINAGTSTLSLTGLDGTFTGAGKTYATVSMTGIGLPRVMDGGNTFTNFTRTGTATVGDQLQFLGNQTITGTLTLTGNSSINRLAVTNGVGGGVLQRTLTAAAVVLTNVILQDIIGAGAATWSGTLVGDATGNSGITFTTPATQTWSGTSGGSWTGNAWSGRMPLPQDPVVINAAFIASQTITVGVPYIGKSLNFTGVSGSPTFNPGRVVFFFGDITFAAGLGTINFSSGGMAYGGNSTVTFTSNGKTSAPGQAVNALFVSNVNATLQFGDDFSTTGGIWVQGGTLKGNGHNVTASVVAAGASIGAATVNLGSGTWTGTGTGNVWNVVAGTGTVTNASTSTIVLSDTSVTAKTFVGAGQVYNNVSFTGGGTGAITITGSNTANTLTINAPKTVIFTAGTTQTVTTFSATGTSGNVITLQSSVAGTAWTLSCANQVSCDYLSLKDSTASGHTPFYAGNHSTNVSGNTNWTFTPPPLSASDTWSFSDSATTSTTLSRSTADSWGITDVATKQDQHQRTGADSFALTDDASRTATQPRSGADSFALTDSATRALMARDRQASDTWGLVDQATRSAVNDRQAVESFAITDQAIGRTTAIRSASDSFALDDQADSVIATVRSAADGWAFLDAVSRAPIAHDRHTVDSFVLGDMVATVTRLSRSAQDAWVMNDQAQGAIHGVRTAADVWSLVDQAVRQVSGGRSAFDSFVITDVATGVLHIALVYEGMLDVAFVATKTDLLIPAYLSDAEVASFKTDSDIVTLLTDAAVTQDRSG